MRARGAPVITSFVASTRPLVVTPDNLTIKPLKQRAMRTTEEKTKRVRMPVAKRVKKPPSVTGYHWRQEGAGWELRKAVYVEENGVRRRKRPYVGHLSQTAFQELKKRHRGAALEKAIAQWIVDHDR